MLTSAANFLNDAAGLEKTLRLVQSFASIVIALSLSASDAAPWLQARSHLVVARRFFRMPKWIDAWQLALQQINGRGETGLRMLLSVCKWSTFGMYMFLEMFTITDAMKITSTTWGPGVLRESLKFWFYAELASILISFYDLFELWTAASSAPATGKGKEESVVDKKESATTAPVKPKPAKIGNTESKQIYKKLVIDCCDILIPGSTVGWINVDPVTVGVTGCISTLVSMGDIWSRVQVAKKIV